MKNGTKSKSDLCVAERKKVLARAQMPYLRTTRRKWRWGKEECLGVFCSYLLTYIMYAVENVREDSPKSLLMDLKVKRLKF